MVDRTQHLDVPPLFIGGAGRSGTTLLVDLLGMHRELSPIYETEYILVLYSLFYLSASHLSFNDRKRLYARHVDEWAESLPHRPHNKREHERYVHGPHYILFSREHMLTATNEFLSNLTPDNLRHAVPSYIATMFSLHAKIDAKPYWVNKTPEYVQISHQLLEWFPKMKFIHIIRDGRDAVLSAMTLPWGAKTLEEGASWWQTRVTSGLRFGEQHPEHYVQLRYEDLIQRPRETVSTLIRSVLNEPNPSEVAEYMMKPIPEFNLAMINKWKRHPDQSALRNFERLTAPLLDRLGYPV